MPDTHARKIIYILKYSYDSLLTCRYTTFEPESRKPNITRNKTDNLTIGTYITIENKQICPTKVSIVLKLLFCSLGRQYPSHFRSCYGPYSSF